MLKLIKKLLEANVLLIAIAITIFIAFLSIANLGKILPNKDLLISDKLNHAIAYFFMALSWFYAFQKKKVALLKRDVHRHFLYSFWNFDGVFAMGGYFVQNRKLFGCFGK